MQGKGLNFGPNSDTKLYCYADADFSGLWKNGDDQDPVCMKSRNVYVITLQGCLFNWVSKLQRDIALPTLESEYIAISQAMHYLVHLWIFIQEVGTELNMEFSSPVIMNSAVFEDSNGALGLATSTRKTTRTRHIAVKYHFFREHVNEGKGIMIQRVESK